MLTSSGTAPQWSSGLTITTLATTGNTTLGDAAADNLTVNATITSNLIFTDNTYDIGASGATRPRSLFLGTNLTVGSLTATRVPYASTGGLLVDSANMTFNGTRLSVADFADASLTSGRVTYATTSGNLTDSANLLYSGTDLTVYGITVGRGAGAVSTNTAVGASALVTNTTGARNVAVGGLSSYSNSTGSSNIFVGYQAGYYNTTSYNIGIGDSALVSNTSGASNVAVGHSALTSNTTASNNTAVGYQAGYSNTTATGLVALGYLAAQANTTGNYNTAIGSNALQLNTTGSGNTMLGLQAGYGITTGSFNTFLGYSSLGYGSGQLVTTGTRNTILGAYNGNQGGLDIRTANNYIVLSDGDGNVRAAFQAPRNSFGFQTDNSGIARLEGISEVTVANGSTLTLTSNECGAALICVYDNNSGTGATFFASYVGGTSLVASDGSGNFATSDTAGKICVYKTGGSHLVTFKNNYGVNLNMSIVIYAAQATS